MHIPILVVCMEEVQWARKVSMSTFYHVGNDFQGIIF